MKPFYTIIYDCNRKRFEQYDVIPYLVKEYEELKKNKVMQRYKPLPKTFDEFKEFVKDESLYRWWGRCEYEIILSSWPGQDVEEKWDIHRQIMMNLDIVTKIVMESIKEK